MINYTERHTGKENVEIVPSGKFMLFLYSHSPIGKSLLWAVFQRKWISTLIGSYMSSFLSRRKIQRFVREYNMDLSDYVIPEKGFRNFNEFFFRSIKPDARPLGSGILSPADGKILVFAKVDDLQTFFIKGRKWNTQEFIGTKLGKAAWSMAIIRLAPVDYHRFHSPISGEVISITDVTGKYLSVSPLALQKRLDIFLENKRSILTIRCSDTGNLCYYVAVGATLTGSILWTVKQGDILQKGEEVGYFAFGGSTIVLLLPEETVQWDADLVKNTQEEKETTILVRESIGRFETNPTTHANNPISS